MHTRISIHPLPRPAPADDLRKAEDRDQAARELKHWTEWPFEIEVEEADGGIDVLYGHEARLFLKEWTALHA
jgi:hypothetical protein